MTATPKETKYISNINYFGEPTYSYSLKQGIRDGFLAPYEVIKVHLDVDIEGYRPTPGEKDITGATIPDHRRRHCEPLTDQVRDCWKKPPHRHCEGQIGLVSLKQSPERLLHSIPELRLIRNDEKG